MCLWYNISNNKYFQQLQRRIQTVQIISYQTVCFFLLYDEFYKNKLASKSCTFWVCSESYACVFLCIFVLQTLNKYTNSVISFCQRALRSYRFYRSNNTQIYCFVRRSHKKTLNLIKKHQRLYGKLHCMWMKYQSNGAFVW